MQPTPISNPPYQPDPITPHNPPGNPDPLTHQRHTRFHHFSGMYNFLNSHGKHVLAISILLSGSMLGTALLAGGQDLDNRNKAFTGFETTEAFEFSGPNLASLGAISTPSTPPELTQASKNLYFQLASNYQSANTLNINQSGIQITASSTYDAEEDKTIVFIRAVNLSYFNDLILHSYFSNNTGEFRPHSVAEFHQEENQTVSYIAAETPGNLTTQFTGITLSYDPPNSSGPTISLLELKF